MPHAAAGTGTGVLWPHSAAADHRMWGRHPLEGKHKAAFDLATSLAVMGLS